jgi:hypothetical protein
MRLLRIFFLFICFSVGFVLLATPQAIAQEMGTTPFQAKELWKITQKMEISEGLDLIQTQTDGGLWFEFDSISCVFEQYNACSFFARIQEQRKLVVNLDEAAEWMKLLAQVGIPVDEDNARMDIGKVSCQKTAQDLSCQVTPY